MAGESVRRFHQPRLKLGSIRNCWPGGSWPKSWPSIPLDALRHVLSSPAPTSPPSAILGLRSCSPLGAHEDRMQCCGSSAGTPRPPRHFKGCLPLLEGELFPISAAMSAVLCTGP